MALSATADEIGTSITDALILILRKELCLERPASEDLRQLVRAHLRRNYPVVSNIPPDLARVVFQNIPSEPEWQTLDTQAADDFVDGKATIHRLIGMEVGRFLKNRFPEAATVRVRHKDAPDLVASTSQLLPDPPPGSGRSSRRKRSRS
jgi:hypothetical protein